MEKKVKEEPIYEKLGPKECMVISRDRNGILYACNVNGKVKLRKADYPSK